MQCSAVPPHCTEREGRGATDREKAEAWGVAGAAWRGVAWHAWCGVARFGAMPCLRRNLDVKICGACGGLLCATASPTERGGKRRVGARGVSARVRCGVMWCGAACRDAAASGTAAVAAEMEGAHRSIVDHSEQATV